MVHNAIGQDWDYEPFSIEYNTPRKYTPDFVCNDIYVECKGYFREGDTQKYRAIDKTLKAQDKRLVFVLMQPSKKVRKGSNITMQGWCEKNDIPWFDLENIEGLFHVDV